MNVAEYDPAMPFDVRVAATYRFGVDARELGEAFFALAPGPSEHAGHPHFQSGLDDWLRGRPAVLVSSRLLVESTAVSRLELVPRP